MSVSNVEDVRYLRCDGCGEFLTDPNGPLTYGPTPDEHECRDYDEEGSIGAPGF